MKKGKKAILAIAAVVVMGMAVIPASIVASDNGDNAQSMLPFGLGDAEKISFNLKELGNNIAPLGNTGNVLITPNSPEDDMLPAITKDGNGNIVVVWSHKISTLDGDFGLAYSTDGGNSWNSNIIEADGFQYYADIGYVTGSQYDEISGTFDGLWLICLEQINEAANLWLITDVTAPDTYEGYALTEGSLPGATYACMEDNAYYYEHSFNYAGPVNFWIDDDQGMVQGWMLFWWAADLSGYVYNWDAESAIDSAPAQDPDMACIHDSDPAWTTDDFFYTVAQHNNEDNGRAEIVYKRCVPNDEDDIEYVDEQFYLDKGDLYDAAHPNVVASGDNVAVVYMKNDNTFGSWDVVCKYSHDRGQTWDTSVVAGDPAINEEYPAAYMSGDTLFCAYVKEGNLYLVKSEDGGATWGEPKQINDQDGTVVAEENCVDIHSGGIVWTDNRNGDKDIYYAPLPAAILNVKSISGGMGIKATVANTGTEDATGVAWSIDVSGLVFVGGHTEGTIDVPAGGEATISSGLVFGIGPGTITVTVGGTSKTASCFILGPLVLGVK